MPEVARVQQQFFLGPAGLLPGRAERHSVETTGKTFRDRQKLEWAERLAHERIGAGLFRTCAGSSLRSREQDNRDVAERRIGLQLTAELQARRAGHVDVQDDHARARTPKLVSRGLRALRLGNLDVRDLEGRTQQGAQSGIVVDKQDPQDARPPFPVPVEECRQPNHVTRVSSQQTSGQTKTCGIQP